MTHLFLADTVTPSEQDCSSLGKLERKQVRLREAEAEGRGSLWNVWVFGIGVRGQEWGWAGSRHFLEWLGSDRGLGLVSLQPWPRTSWVKQGCTLMS